MVRHHKVGAPKYAAGRVPRSASPRPRGTTSIRHSQASGISSQGRESESGRESSPSQTARAGRREERGVDRRGYAAVRFNSATSWGWSSKWKSPIRTSNGTASGVSYKGECNSRNRPAGERRCCLQVVEQLFFRDVEHPDLDQGARVGPGNQEVESSPRGFELLELRVMQDQVQLAADEPIPLGDAPFQHGLEAAGDRHLAALDLLQDLADQDGESFRTGRLLGVARGDDHVEQADRPDVGSLHPGSSRLGLPRGLRLCTQFALRAQGLIGIADDGPEQFRQEVVGIDLGLKIAVSTPDLHDPPERLDLPRDAGRNESRSPGIAARHEVRTVASEQFSTSNSRRGHRREHGIEPAAVDRDERADTGTQWREWPLRLGTARQVCQHTQNKRKLSLEEPAVLLHLVGDLDAVRSPSGVSRIRVTFPMAASTRPRTVRTCRGRGYR